MRQKDIRIGELYNYVNLGCREVVEVVGKVGEDRVQIFPSHPNQEYPSSPWIVDSCNITELGLIERMEIATTRPYQDYSEQEVKWIVEIAIGEYARTGDISKGVEAGKMLVEEIRKLN